MLLLVLTCQLIQPGIASALTTGPSQPEVQSFEPVGTTDMVDMFSGDFVYNIPLMDVEGYPINISYHGGASMEQEATWVGLGWNINPGVINRTVRGLPDDFKGEELTKELNIKPEKTVRVGMGVGLEAFGLGDPLLSLSASLGANLNINNYKGVSVDFNVGGGVTVFNSISAGVNIGVGSQTGADIDYNASFHLSSSNIIGTDMAAGIGVSEGSGWNSRTGMKDRSFTVSASVTGGGGSGVSTEATATVPVGIKNFVPVITNSSTMTTIMGRIKFGAEVFWCQGYGNISGMVSNVTYSDADASRDAYGYLYLQNGHDRDILDFTRDKDGLFNKTMEYLPSGNATYDIYSVAGQGTGGSYRPYRNDFGSVYDPTTSSTASNASAGAEAAIGWNFEIGADGSVSETDITSGPWQAYKKRYAPRSTGSLYEDTYFKQAGELTEVDPGYLSTIGGLNPVLGTQTLPGTKPYATTKRDPRGNVFSYLTAADAVNSGVGNYSFILNYKDTTGLTATPTIETIDREPGGDLQRKSYQISMITQLQTDGRRYVFGIPAMNNIQKEVTFSVNGPTDTNDLAKGLVPYARGYDDSKSNANGIDNYYSSTVTPSYAHSYLLTAVLSPDYVDVTGDGPSDDDLGSYTKFNYALKEKDYRWRAPYDSGKAQYSPGFWAEPRDDKGSYLVGSREEWIQHSIETKNFVAEFYTSKRNDGLGCKDTIVKSGKYNVAPYNQSLAQAASSYKLDSIKLYNKHDRFINGNNAVPIKTVFFVYDYSLCPGVPNFVSGAGASGKLTLKKIYMRYGNSQRSMLSPYRFDYSGFNPSYNLASKDRWGSYKPNHSSFTNYEYPYVDQNNDSDNTYATAWSLSKITLPSGGVIQANYESDDYAFVQDQPASEMFMVQGIGKGQDYDAGSQLYSGPNSPNPYVYFLRRSTSELGGLNFGDNYSKGLSNIYFNFNVQLVDNKYEQIKGYATADDIGVCPNDSRYGYVKLTSVVPRGGGALLNPVAYTAINTSRYNLPQIMYKGSDPNASDLSNILAGLKGSFDDLVDIGVNPVTNFAKKGVAKIANIQKSFVRLISPGLKKKGGGQRVKSLVFYDSWNALAGGNEQQATYGKQYDYTISDDTYGTISSGVASYEPMIGGDENTMRNPVQFSVQAGNRWPPNDPVDLYQETPIGESLFPTGTVGYSQVTVKSIHADTGRSSQAIDVYQFYTSRDFPAKVMSTGLSKIEDAYHFDLFSQKNLFSATEGYTLVFNDMHGKPKSVQHFEYHPQGATSQLISSQVYTYNTTNGQLDNNVPVITYEETSGKMHQVTEQLGVEADITFDTREKNENTQTDNLNANFNLSIIPILFVPVPIPVILGFGYQGNYQNRFRSVVATKVVQQYGILKQVQSYNEGAVTTVTNEAFDPKTGQVVMSSVNNEFQDKEYNVNIPAYWAYRNMGTAYMNIGYEDTGTLKIQAYGLALLNVGDRLNHYNIGDELLVHYGSNWTTAWVMKPDMGDTTYVPPQSHQDCCEPILLPRFRNRLPSGWTAGAVYSGADIKVIRSGRHNQLNENVETYAMMSSPVNSTGYLKDTLDHLINLHAKTFSDVNTAIVYQYLGPDNDTVNPFLLNGMGNYKESAEYGYAQSRSYNTSSSRTAGLFSALNFCTQSPPDPPICGIYDGFLNGNPPHVSCDGLLTNSYLYVNSSRDVNWYALRTITKWSPHGKEIEDMDATGIYSTVQYGYNEALPVAAATNAKQGDIFADGFEDYCLIKPIDDHTQLNYSPFNIFSLVALGTSQYDLYKIYSNTTVPNLARNIAHTGYFSLQVPATHNTTPNGWTDIYKISMLGMRSYLDASQYLTNHQIPFSAAYDYRAFGLTDGVKYIMSCWVKPVSAITNPLDYSSDLSSSHQHFGVYNSTTAIDSLARKTSNVIDGWQQYEVTFFANGAAILLPTNYYIDDIRIYPAAANMKSFVYNPINEKLIATLDENNFATTYEYDQEGNLIRTKKETEKGVLTVSESRSNNPRK